MKGVIVMIWVKACFTESKKVEWLYIIKEHANIMKFIIKMIYISMAYVYSRMLFAMYSVSKRA